MNGVDAAFHRPHEVRGRRIVFERAADRDDAVEDPLHTAGLERQHRGGGNASGPLDVGRRDCTYLAVLLRDQQIRLQGIDQLGLDVIKRLAGLQSAPDLLINVTTRH